MFFNVQKTTCHEEWNVANGDSVMLNLCLRMGKGEGEKGGSKKKKKEKRQNTK